MSQQDRIPDHTVETIARSFYRESRLYGFGTGEYLRFVNLILKLSQEGTEDQADSQPQVEPPLVADGAAPLTLPLQGTRIAIRTCSGPEDEGLLRGWLQDRDGRHFLLSRSTARSPDLTELLHSPENHLGLIVLPSSRPIGAVAFLDHDVEQGKAEMRKLIGEPDMRGRGYAKEATQLWIRFGLGGLNLNKIYLNTLGTNLSNIRLNEELGFKVEGILRNEVMIDGAYHDVLRMGLLRSAVIRPGADPTVNLNHRG